MVALAVATMASCSGAPDLTERLDRLAEAPGPDRFVVVDRPDLPGLQACIFGERPLRIAVRLSTGDRLVSDADDPGPPLALVVGGVRYVSRQAVAGWSGGAQWVRLAPGPVPPPLEAALGPAIGRVLEQAPAAPQAIVADALERATSVEAIRSDRGDAVRITSVATDPSLVTDAAPTTEKLPVDDRVTLDVTLSGDRIVEIRATPDAGDDHSSAGFTLSYPDEAGVIPDEPPADVEEWAAVSSSPVATAQSCVIA